MMIDRVDVDVTGREEEQGIRHGYGNGGFGGVAARETRARTPRGRSCRHGQSSAPLSPPLSRLVSLEVKNSNLRDALPLFYYSYSCILTTSSKSTLS